MRGQHEGPKGYQLQYKVKAPREEFAQLYKQMLNEQWQIDDGSIDWTKKPVVEGFGFIRQDLTEIRAQFVANALIAEEFAFRGIGNRLDQLEEADEKACFAIIIADEHRHALALSRYQELLGEYRKPDPRMVEEMYKDETFDVEAVAVLSLVGESLLAEALPSVWRFTRDPLLRALLPKMARDENRHVAFARLYLNSRSSGWSSARKAFLTETANHAFKAHAAFCLDIDQNLLERLSPAASWAAQRVSANLFHRIARKLKPEFQAMGLILEDDERYDVEKNIPTPHHAFSGLGLPE